MRSFGSRFSGRDSQFSKSTEQRSQGKSKCQEHRRTQSSVSAFIQILSVGLHILYQKTDGPNFKRNEYANELEVFCKTYFYGPLVIAFSDANAPYRLYDFPPNFLYEKI